MANLPEWIPILVGFAIGLALVLGFPLLLWQLSRKRLNLQFTGPDARPLAQSPVLALTVKRALATGAFSMDGRRTEGQGFSPKEVLGSTDAAGWIRGPYVPRRTAFLGVQVPKRGLITFSPENLPFFGRPLRVHIDRDGNIHFRPVTPDSPE